MINANKIIRNILGNNNQKQRKVRQNKVRQNKVKSRKRLRQDISSLTLNKEIVLKGKVEGIAVDILERKYPEQKNFYWFDNVGKDGVYKTTGTTSLDLYKPSGEFYEGKEIYIVK